MAISRVEKSANSCQFLLRLSRLCGGIRAWGNRRDAIDAEGAFGRNQIVTSLLKVQPLSVTQRLGFQRHGEGKKNEPQKMAAQRRGYVVGQLLLASPASVVSRKLTTRALLASLTSLNRLRFSDYFVP